MKLLTNVDFHTKTNNWYAPTCEFHEKHKSIIRIEIMDNTSSAGDWSGFILQKTGKNTVHAIGFSQENCHPHDGFMLYTAEHPFYKGRVDEANLVENVKSCWLQCSVLD